MILTRLILAASVFMTITHRAWGSDPQSNATLTVILELSDGSRVIGTPGIEAVAVQTSYAKMNVPLKQILTLKMGDDHETAALEMQNGDTLKGVITLAPITLETVFGKAAIGTEHIRVLSVRATGGALPESLRKGLVLYYSFDRDDGEKVMDLSGSGNHGAVAGAKFSSAGKIGGAYQFNGKDSYIDTQRNLTGMNEITACGWVFFSEPPGDSHLVGQFGGGVSEDVWGLAGGGHAGGNSRRSWAGVNAGGNLFTVQGSEVERNRWRHVCLTFARGKALSLYENGVLIQSVPVPDQPLRTNPRYTTKVGASQNADAYWANGLIDEVMIYNRALSADEVKNLYEAQN